MASETTADLVVRGARLDRDAAGGGAPAGALVDVVVRDGAITAIGPDAATGTTATEVIDADGGLGKPGAYNVATAQPWQPDDINSPKRAYGKYVTAMCTTEE